MLPYLDVLVDGPFILEQRDTELLFRGSPNQRIIYLHGEPEEDIIPGTVPIVPLR
jgi:anaerobic ribonucleoside-triphosphate reductase activating protein